MSTTKLLQNKNQQLLTPKIIEWGGDDPFTHTLVVGPTRCGKTSQILKPLIYQILKAKKRGIPVGLSLIEPKGDVARMVKEMADGMGLSDELVYIDPLYPNETNRINVMKGDKADVAEATVAVLKSLFGKQDAFFATVQELSSRKVTLLLKELYGDNMDIMDVLSNLRDVTILQTNVEKLRAARGNNDLVQFFDNELLGKGNLADKYRQFIVGLRAQLENITSNDRLRAIVTGKSDIDLDEHFERGGILAANTALGLLGRSGDAFGMFLAMHLQLATFRRPGAERTRVPHYLIIDEYSRYINPDVERFLSISAEYRVALIAAIQSFGQLELESGNLSAKAMKRAILTSTRNKIVFGGLEYEDAEEASKIFGKNLVRERERMFSGGILENILPKHYRDTEEEKQRFYATFLMDGLPRFHYVHKLLIDGTPQEPGIAVGDFVPRDWKEQLEKEDNETNINKIPSIWDWRNRANFEVKKKRLEEARERRAQAEKIFSFNPFDDNPTKNNMVTEQPKKNVIPSPKKEVLQEPENQKVILNTNVEAPRKEQKEDGTTPKSIVFDMTKMKREKPQTEDSESVKKEKEVQNNNPAITEKETLETKEKPQKNTLVEPINEAQQVPINDEEETFW